MFDIDEARHTPALAAGWAPDKLEPVPRLSSRCTIWSLGSFCRLIAKGGTGAAPNLNALFIWSTTNASSTHGRTFQSPPHPHTRNKNSIRARIGHIARPALMFRLLAKDGALQTSDNLTQSVCTRMRGKRSTLVFRSLSRAHNPQKRYPAAAPEVPETRSNRCNAHTPSFTPGFWFQTSL